MLYGNQLATAGRWQWVMNRRMGREEPNKEVWSERQMEWITLLCHVKYCWSHLSCQPVLQWKFHASLLHWDSSLLPTRRPEGFSEAIAWMPTEIPSAFTHVQVSSGKFKLVKPSFTHLGRNQLFLWVQRSEKHFINLLQNSQWIQHSLPFLLSLFDSLCPSLLFQRTMSQHSSTGKYVLCSGRKLFTYEELTRPPIGTRKKQGKMWNGSYGYWPCESKHKRVLLT